MVRSRRSLVSTLAVGAVSAALGGCVEAGWMPGTEPGPEANAPGAQASAPLVVQTQFVLGDVDGFDDLELDEISVNIGAIFLDPVDGAVAFSTRTPLHVHLDLAAGERTFAGPSLALPFGGDFGVSVQVEPPEITDGKALSARDSLVVSGRYLAIDEPDLDEPSPLPWRPKNLQTSTSIERSVPFTYRSGAVARLAVGEVALDDAGSYVLTLRVDLEGWIRDELVPSLDAASDDHSRPVVTARLPDDSGVAELQVLEDHGSGLEGLIGDIDVGAQPF